MSVPCPPCVNSAFKAWRPRWLGTWIQLPQSRAIRDGLLWLLPYLMIWTSCLVLSELARSQDLQHWLVDALGRAAQVLRDALPLAIWGSVTSMLAVQNHLPRAPLTFIAVAVALMVDALLRAQAPALLSLHVSLAIAGPLLLVPLVLLFHRLSQRLVDRQDMAAGRNVTEVLHLVFPAIGATLVLLGLLAGLLQAFSWLGQWLPPLSPGDVPLQLIAAAYCVLNSISWALGIHGYYALYPLLQLIPLQPTATEPLSQAFLGVYVFIGGSGATASLVLAMLLTARDRKDRLVAAFSVLPGLLNINELLLYGLPLILNRHLFWPFLLTPLVNLITSCIALQMGWVPTIDLGVPFTSPVLLNALWGSGGEPAAALMQLFNLALGMLIYWPFVRRWENAQRDSGPFLLKSLETSYQRRQEEAELTLDDPVRRHHEVQAERRHLHERMQPMSDAEFVLHYQPKVDPAHGRVVSCEALLRLDQGTGRLLSPGEFLDNLTEAGLMAEVDQWVLEAVVEQAQAWQAQGLMPLSIAVNLSVDTLSDVQAMGSCLRWIRRCPWPLIIEITEQALLNDETRTRLTLAALRQAGAKVHLDDFGTGFSSLSYLHRFDIDGIKIDRSFVRSLDLARGRSIFVSLCQMARELGLELVVEGVEEDWQLAQMPKGQPVTVQGWIYARAMAPDDFMRYRDELGAAPSSLLDLQLP